MNASLSTLSLSLILSLILVNVQNLQANSTSQESSVIRNVILSRKCEQLTQIRTENQLITAKLKEMIIRNIKLTNRTPPNKLSILNALRENKINLKQMLQITNIKLEAHEEDIIRSGCPGIVL